MLRRMFALVLAGFLVATAAAAGSARVRVTDLSPFTVRGTGFAPREPVRVSVHAGGTVARRVVTGAAGGFVARFQTVKVGSCTAYLVRAIGASGDATELRVRAPECPMPLTP